MPDMKLDKKDLEILRLVQKNCKASMKDVALKINSPITTVHAKLKRMEDLGLIKNYKAILDPKKLEKGTSAFVLVKVLYPVSRDQVPTSQIGIVKRISKLPEVQEAHMVSGDYDIIIKIKVKDVEEMGKFVTDKLRKVEGVARTLSCIVFASVKETTDIAF